MNTTLATSNGKSNITTQPEPAISQKFVAKVSKQFQASVGSVIAWTDLEQALAQNLYVKLDTQFRALEAKRASISFKKNDPPITWENINMEKLAIDAVARVKMGLDANLPNHIHVIPYLNGVTKKYDVDLRIGYMGVDHVSRKFAKREIVDIRYKLVHETDEFQVLIQNGIEVPYFKQTNPFNPGAVIGAYGYIMHDDPRLNRVVVIEYREFEKAMKASKGVEFWGGIQTEWKDGKKVEGEYDEKFMKEMQYKTVVFRTNKHIALDPAKINLPEFQNMVHASFGAVEAEMAEIVEQHANGETLSLNYQTPENDETPNQQQSEPQGNLIEDQKTGQDSKSGGPGF